MKLNETEVTNHQQSLLGRDRDGFQQAWVDILEADPQTLEEITPIVRKMKVTGCGFQVQKNFMNIGLF